MNQGTHYDTMSVHVCCLHMSLCVYACVTAHVRTSVPSVIGSAVLATIVVYTAVLVLVITVIYIFWKKINGMQIHTDNQTDFF